jgi:hypothetical protein
MVALTLSGRYARRAEPHNAKQRSIGNEEKHDNVRQA